MPMNFRTIISKALYKCSARLLLCGALSLAIMSSHAFSQPRHFPAGTQAIMIANTSGIRSELLQNIAPIIEKSISAGNYPGAVVLIGHRGKIIYRGVFGNKRILPNVAAMQFNTIFDIASLTKVVGTTPAIMQLLEQGKIDLDAPVARYWPDFAKNNKQTITVRELLTHTSGLPADINLPSNKISQAQALSEICDLKLISPPGTKFLYSDVNFMVLAHLVEIASHENFNNYVQKHIFQPLQMKHTFFNPPKKIRDQIAPTELKDKELRWGEVQDPIAYAVGGVSGNAGLFSSANDLGIYAQSLLNGGKLPSSIQKINSSKNTKNADTKNANPNKANVNKASTNKPSTNKSSVNKANTKITNAKKTNLAKQTKPAKEDHFLGPLSILKMTSSQTPASLGDTRGLGWDIDSRYSNRGVLFPTSSFGHTGWTGASLWIDPATQTWIVILASRAHPSPAKNNQLVQDRRTIANIVSASIIDIANVSLNNTGKGELARAYGIRDKQPLK